MSRLRSFIDRINSLKDEQDGIDGQIRTVYAEAGKARYDKTAMGQVVTILRKQNNDAAGYAEASQRVRSYLDELGFSAERVAPHACACESIPTPKIDPTRPLTTKERVRDLMAHHRAKERGEIPQDAELPAHLRAAS